MVSPPVLTTSKFIKNLLFIIGTATNQGNSRAENDRRFNYREEIKIRDNDNKVPISAINSKDNHGLSYLLLGHHVNEILL